MGIFDESDVGQWNLADAVDQMELPAVCPGGDDHVVGEEEALTDRLAAVSPPLVLGAPTAAAASTPATRPSSTASPTAAQPASPRPSSDSCDDGVDFVFSFRR